jgi:hypothetical protein
VPVAARVADPGEAAGAADRGRGRLTAASRRLARAGADGLERLQVMAEAFHLALEDQRRTLDRAGLPQHLHAVDSLTAGHALGVPTPQPGVVGGSGSGPAG